MTPEPFSSLPGFTRSATKTRRGLRRKTRSRFMSSEHLEERNLLAGDVMVRFEYVDGGQNVVNDLTVGESYTLNTYVQDIRNNPGGILMAYLDFTFDSNLISVPGPITHGPALNVATSGDLNTAGVINEVGGFDTDSFPGLPPANDPAAELLWFSIPFTVQNTVGSLVFTPNEADVGNNGVFTFDDTSEVQLDDIMFVGNTVTVNPEDLPELTIAGTTDGNETGPSDGVFTVTQSKTTGTDTVISYTVSGTASSGTDFTALSGTVTIPANQTTATINVPVLTDDLIEADETVIVTLDSITSGDPTVSIGTTDAATISILDDDTATIAIAATTNGNETGPVDGQFTVTQSGISSTDTVIGYTVSGSATSGDDFTALSGSVTIPAGSTTATIDVPVIDDAVIEALEEVTITLDAVTSGDLQITIANPPDRAATITITDNDTAAVSLAATRNGDEEGPVSAQFTVTLTDESSTDTVIAYTTSGSATSVDDFTASGTVTIPAGNLSAVIDIPVVDDSIAEGTETLTVTLDSITSGDAEITIDTNNDEATVDILDNDMAAVSIAATTNGDEEGPVNGQFTVTQSAPSAVDTTVTYTVGGTATSGDDFTALSGSVTIPAGMTSATIDVAVIDDTDIEATETVIVTLDMITAGNNVAINPVLDEATIEIADNDGATVTVAATTNGDEEGPVNGVFTITQSAISNEDTVLAYTISGTATSGDDFTATSGTVTIPAGQTSAAVTIAVIDDMIVEETEDVTLTLDSITSGSPSVTVDAVDNDTLTIADNDTAEVSVEVGANATEATAGTINITLSQASSTDTTVSYTVGGTATPDSDYQALSGTATVPAGQTSVAITVTPIADDEVEGTETVIVTIDSITSGDGDISLAASPTATLELTDDGDSATVSIAAGDNGNEDGPVDGTFVVTQSEISSTDTVIAYTVAGTATEGDDYASLTGTVTILAGETTATITVSPIDDAVIEGTETVEITLDSITSGQPAISIDSGNATATIDILDNEDALVSIAAGDNGDEEGPVNGTFTVTQDIITGVDTVISYSITGGTATDGDDFTTLSGTVTIAAGNTSATINVATIDDGLIEGTESLELTLTAIDSGSGDLSIDVANDVAAIDILDNDTAMVSIVADANGAEAGPVDGQFTVTLSAASAHDTVVTYSVTGTATEGDDFTALSGTVTITAGLTSATITVPVIDDAMVEGDETVIVTLDSVANDSGAVTIDGTADSDTITITDNGDTAEISIARTANGSEEPLSDGQFTVTMTAASSTDTVISYTVGGTATAGDDYTALSGTVTIPAGTTSAVIDVVVIDDTEVEGQEDVIVTLDSITSGDPDISIDTANDSATVRISDNETPFVRVSAAVAGDEEGPVDGSFTISQTISTGTDTIVTYTITGTATSGDDFTALSGTATILTGQTSVQVIVPVLDDMIVEDLETVTLTIDSISGDASLEIDDVQDSRTLSILDNDMAEVTVTATANGDEDGPVNGQFTFSLSMASSTDTTIAYTVSGTATPDSDYTALSGTVTIPAGQTDVTVDVLVSDDLVAEGDETVVVTLDSITSGLTAIGLGVTDTEATVTIADDDGALVSIAQTADGDEDGPVNGQFTVTQTLVAEVDTVIAYTVTGTATSGDDFTALSGTVTILAGETTSLIDVSVIDDAHIEGDETVVVTLDSITSGAPVVAIDNTSDTATVTIADNDTGVVTVANGQNGDEDGPINGQFVVTLSAASETDTTVSYTVTGSATSGDDFTALSGTVTILAGETTATIDVAVIDDAVIEGDETVILTLDAITAGVTDRISVGTTDSATVTIVDDDDQDVLVSIAQTADGDENGPVNGQFTVSITAMSASDTVISYTVGGTATADADYTALSGSVTILAGETTATIDVAVLDDLVVEDLETVIVTLDAITAGEPAIDIDDTMDTATVNIADDGDTALVSIAADNDGSETGPANGQFTVTLTAASSTDTVIAYSVAGTATADSDYTALSGSVTIPAGSTSATIDVAVLDDNLVEDDETVIVTLDTITAGDTDISLDTGADEATVNITSEDVATISIAATTNGDEEGPVNGVFTVTLSQASGTDTTVSYTVAGTATSGDDFTALSGSVTILAGETTATIDVAIVDDQLLEDTEDVIVTLDTITDGAAQLSLDTAADEATIDVTDNETGLISIAATTNGDENGPVNGVFTVTQDGITSVDTVILYSVTGTATSGDDFTALSGTVTITAGQTSATITVPVLDDTLIELAETVIVTLDTIDSGDNRLAIDTANDEATVTIDSDENGIVSIVANDDGDETGPGNGDFFIALSGEADRDITVNYTVSGTATSGDDFTALPGSVTIPAGQTSVTVTVSVIDDNLIEGVETVVLTLDSLAVDGLPVTISSTDDEATIDILDDDVSMISIAAGTNGDEDAPTDGTFTVTMSEPSSMDTTVSFSVTGTATSGDDFTALSGTVTIPAGQTSAAITVDVIDDIAVEGDETVTVTLDSITAGAMAGLSIDSANDDATIDLLDDEVSTDPNDTNTATVSFEVADSSVVEGAGTTTVNVVLNVPSGGTLERPVTVNISVTGGTATATTDFTLDTTTVTFAAGSGDGDTQTVTLSIVDDTNDETSETVQLTLDVPNTSDILLPEAEPTVHTLEILDDANNATMSGSVYVDGNKNGTRDANEIGVPGITITLSGQSNGGETIELTAMTDDNGDYSFTDLPGGVYAITQEHSDALHDFDNTLGGNTTGTINGNAVVDITLEAGGTLSGFGFGEAGLDTPFANIRYILASSNYTELFRESVARAKELDGDTTGAEEIRNASIPSVVSSGLGTSSATTNGGSEGEGEGDGLGFTPPIQLIPTPDFIVNADVEDSGSQGDVNGDVVTDVDSDFLEGEPEIVQAPMGPMPADTNFEILVGPSPAPTVIDDLPSEGENAAGADEEESIATPPASSDAPVDYLAAFLSSSSQHESDEDTTDSVFGSEDDWLELDIDF